MLERWHILESRRANHLQSPALSRSSSAVFAPGPHRRSHPNLQNLHSLSLAPLTPKYPIDPADYDAYYDPSTSELHTSSSLSRIATLPSPGSILANSPVRSRNNSRSRLKRKAKSHVNIQEPERELKATVTDEETDIVDHKPLPRSSKSHPNVPKLYTDPSWLVQTGLSLTESNRETKGQSWISKRDSSTSLANTPIDSSFDAKRSRDGRTPRSGRATPARSRVGSRNVSRNTSQSRLSDLRMTSTRDSTDTITATPGASFATAPELDDQIQEEDEEEYNMEPNWADAKTQAEMAAQLQEELAAEFEDDGDPYGLLNFEEQGDTSEDEEEVRRAMRTWGVGGWLDGAVDALLLVEEGRSEEHSGTFETGIRRVSLDTDDPEGSELPPERARGVWDDLTWFGRLVRRNVAL